MKYTCCTDTRLRVVKAAGEFNGIEYLEVGDQQRTLFVRLLLPPSPALDATQVRIDGGERIPRVAVDWVATADALPAGTDPALVAGLDDPGRVLVVRVKHRGDLSRYTLHVLAAAGADEPPSTFDPLLSTVDFRFAVDCDSEFDCADDLPCPPPEQPPTPPIDYLARDYAGLRRLLLDRLSLLEPDWRERSPADLGIALVELVAYLGDRLTYRQDAIATEAYLATSRRRVSLRRHTRLVDYRVHEGCAARVWARIEVKGGEPVPLPAGTPLLTRVPRTDALLVPDGPAHRAALASGAVVFETVDDHLLYADHREFAFYTWGALDCCLPAGATTATLHGDHPHLKAGDVLVLAETRNPRSGKESEADPAHRWPVRLTSVHSGRDDSGGRFADEPTGSAVDVTEIGWDPLDALPFPLCITVDGGTQACALAWGNVVLADHGRTVDPESLGTVPAADLFVALDPAGDRCERPDSVEVPVRFRPVLGRAPLTHALPVAGEELFHAERDDLVTDLIALDFSTALRDWLAQHGISFAGADPLVRGGDGDWSVASGATVVRLRLVDGQLRAYGRSLAALRAGAAEPRLARPQITLTGKRDKATHTWVPRPDLLASDGNAAEFTVEIEHDGTVAGAAAGRTTLRFGDNRYGARPEAGTSFVAHYRVGNGRAGNVGAGSLAHIVSTDGRLSTVDNPLPAAGGVEPERPDEVRRDAPQAFLTQRRAVTEADYAAMAGRYPGVQRAAATMRWTGSWHTVFVTADRLGGAEVDSGFEHDLAGHLERYRMAGYDLEIEGPRYVPLDLELSICVHDGHLRGHVRRALLFALGSGVAPDGSLGLFHPDRLSFGQPVYLSPIYAAAQAVPGVAAVTVRRFGRQREVGGRGLEDGVLDMGRLEIARLDNDRNFPERGVLRLDLVGGR